MPEGPQRAVEPAVPPATPVATSDPSPRAEAPLVAKVRKPLIEAVEVSPQLPCRDEEVLVTVRLKPGAAQNAKVSIRGRMGDRAIFVFDRAGPIDVHVLADDWLDGMDSRSVRVSIGECVPRPRLMVTAEPIGAASYRFSAVSTTPGERLEQVRWRVGDEAWTAGGPTIERSFALRKQRAPHETVLVEAEAGAQLRGRATVFLVNQSQLTRLMGNAFLPVVASQFPERLKGTLVSRVELRNLFERPTAFDTVTVRAFPCVEGAPTETDWQPSEVLDRVNLEADAITTLRLSLPERAAAGACSLEIRLKGQAGAEPFTAMWGLATGVPTNAVKVSDPALAERLLKAQQALGRSQITPAELERFERAP